MDQLAYRLFGVTAVIFVFALAAYSQFPDNKEIKILRSTVSDPVFCRPENSDADKAPIFKSYKAKACKAEVDTLAVNYDTERLIYWSAASDCHMRTVTKAFRSDLAKQVSIVTNVFYGGCRAGGMRSGWIVIERPPEGFKIVSKEVRVDHPASDRRDNFIFVQPKNAPTLRTEPASVIEIDTGNCLPLTGQSVWQISSNEHLKNALDGKPNSSACTADIESKVDLSRETLVGYSFASGYCGMPKGMSLTAEKQTADDGSDNIIRVTVIYEKSIDPCPKWSTFPVWFAVPKPPAGYTIKAENRSK